MKRALWIGVSVVSLGAVVWWVSHQQAPRMPTGAGGVLWLAASLAVYATALALRGWRWHRIMALSDLPHRRSDAFGLVLVAYMGNTVLPARGGEVLRVTFMKKRSPASLPEVVGSVIAERLFDLVALGAMLAALAWGGVAGAPTGRLAADIAAGVILAAATGFALYLALRRRGRIEALTVRIRPFVRASKLLTRPQGAQLLGMSLLIWLLEGFTFMLVGNALALHLSIVEALLTAVIAALASSLPAGPGYAGSFDAGVLLALHASRIFGASAVGFLLLARFVIFVPVTIVGAALLITRYGGLHLQRRKTPGLPQPQAVRVDAAPSAAIHGAHGDL